MVAKADRGRVIEAIDLLCDTPTAGSALKSELEAMAAQRTGGPGGEHLSSPRGLSLALHHPAARCSWNTGLFRSAAKLDAGGELRQPKHAKGRARKPASVMPSAQYELKPRESKIVYSQYDIEALAFKQKRADFYDA
jgi:hypothetical protein